MNRTETGALALLFVIGPAFAAAPPEPAGYRMEDYRAPTPASLTGAVTITTAEAKRLWESKGAIFVDVFPQPPRPVNLPAETLWRPPPRESIPGAIWLPNVGFGSSAPEIEAYFRDGLAAATNQNPDRPIVLFCMRDCWMSWNAGKRALSYGYRAVYWFPDGTDGWKEAGLALERVEPAR
jgi:PQQ-dependent catabolism-associated CXXCW motif protein